MSPEPSLAKGVQGWRFGLGVLGLGFRAYGVYRAFRVYRAQGCNRVLGFQVLGRCLHVRLLGKWFCFPGLHKAEKPLNSKP